MAYKYFAFISYNSKDKCWGKRLQRRLENYRMPATLCSEHQWKSNKPMRPIFFAPTDIQPGGLPEELRQRLLDSKYLIVICSPNSAKSEWVGEEIDFFHSLGRINNLFLFIVRGEPHNIDPRRDCFHPKLTELGIPEQLGANIHERFYFLPWLNRQRAIIQLITKLLGIEFDVLWNRHRRLLIQQTILWTLGAIAIVLAIITALLVNRPTDVTISFREPQPINTSLPPLHNARLSLILNNERKDTIVRAINQPIVFCNIPHYMVNKPATILFTCEDYLSLDTMVNLSNDIVLNICRDVDAYGHVHFTLYDNQRRKLGNTPICIGNVEACTDMYGRVDVHIPLPKQQTAYPLHSTVELSDSIKDAKCGSNDAIFTK